MREGEGRAHGQSLTHEDWIARQLRCYPILNVRPWFAVTNSGGGSSAPAIQDVRAYVPGTKTDPYAN